MLQQLLMFAQETIPPAAEPLPDRGIIQFEWYSYAGVIGVIVLLIGLKIYKNKTMT